MAVHNSDIAALFYRMAELLEIEGANPFRIRAYRRAAATVENLPEPAARLIAKGTDLTELPAIGDDLAGKIKEICATGQLQALKAVEARTPPALLALSALPGLGPKRIWALYQQLGVTSVQDLAKAASEGRVRALPRFGAAFEAKLLKAALASPTLTTPRFKISTAEDFAVPLAHYLATLPDVSEVVLAGSYRRRKETVGDLDILAISAKGQATIDRFVTYDEVVQILGKGTTRSTVVLRCGLQVDLRVVTAQSYGAALVYFTGSKAHNIALRRLAQTKGLKISEYGVYKGAKRIAGRTEAEVYQAVDLPWIAPELREDRGEIDAALADQLPQLVERDQVRGDLHVHSRASDGTNTIDEIVSAAKARGYDYLAIADHSKHATIAHGLDAGRLSAQIDEIDQINAADPGIKVLKYCEVDILKDGQLDLPNALLSRLDLVIGAVHSELDLSLEAQTTRVLRALDNPHLKILAHPTGRLIGERPPYPIDLDRVMQAMKVRGQWMEINAHPSRLDLNDVHICAAKDMGLKLAIGSDAHSTGGLGMIGYGVDQARRGWLEAGDVINTRTWPELQALLRA